MTIKSITSVAAMALIAAGATFAALNNAARPVLDVAQTERAEIVRFSETDHANRVFSQTERNDRVAVNSRELGTQTAQTERNDRVAETDHANRVLAQVEGNDRIAETEHANRVLAQVEGNDRIAESEHASTVFAQTERNDRVAVNSREIGWQVAESEHANSARLG